MSTLVDFVVGTLRSNHIERVNFRFGSALVYPSGYRSDIAQCIGDGLIRVTSDPADLTPSPTSTTDGSYTIWIPPGQRHYFYISPRLTEMRGGRLRLKGNLSPTEQARLRGTIVHECTHALHDYQRASLDPRTAEGAAYLAGAITSLLWGFRMPGPIVEPCRSANSYSLVLAQRIIDEPDAARRYLVPNRDVAILRSLVTTGAARCYAFNGI